MIRNDLPTRIDETMTKHTLKLVLLATVATGLVGCSKPPAAAVSAPASRREISATIAKVVDAQVGQQFHVTGTLVAREEASVSTQLSGYPVSQVLVEQGAKVIAGQTLAQLDDQLLKSQIDQQTAVVQQQQVAFDRASQEAQRVANLDTQGALSTEAVKERVLAAQSAKASLAQAQAQLNDYNIRLGLMTIRAPVAGIVLTRTVRPGDVVSPGTTLFTLARDSLIELQADVPEASLDSVKPGTPVQVTLPSDKQLAGSVRLVSPKVDAETKLGTVLISLPLDPDLKLGGFGDATIGGVVRTVPVVPIKAVNYDADGASLFVLDDKNIAHRQLVKTGATTNDSIELVSGPAAGTTIVARGTELLLPGDKIKPANVVPGGEK